MDSGPTQSQLLFAPRHMCGVFPIFPNCLYFASLGSGFMWKVCNVVLHININIASRARIFSRRLACLCRTRGPGNCVSWVSVSEVSGWALTHKNQGTKRSNRRNPRRWLPQMLLSEDYHLLYPQKRNKWKCFRISWTLESAIQHEGWQIESE